MNSQDTADAVKALTMQLQCTRDVELENLRDELRIDAQPLYGRCAT